MVAPLSGSVLTAAEMRAAEAAVMAAGTSVDALMERAGRALAESVWRFGGDRPVLVLCGPGNNGGDGYVAARFLRERGLPVRIAALAPPATEAARRAALGWAAPVETMGSAQPAPLLLDCLFGTGLTRPLDLGLCTELHRLADAARFIIAADVPSGVSTDEGTLLGAAAANVTLALGALKPAHLLQPAAGLCGHILQADLGIPVDSSARVATRPRLPSPGPGDHKYTRGLVTVIAGHMAGAAGLCAAAAARSGAGYVVLAGSHLAADTLPLAIVHRPVAEALSDHRTGALVIGPGLGRDVVAKERLADCLASTVPVVIDADALGLVDPRQLAKRGSATILTPHEGEFTRLFGSLGGNKIERARQAARLAGSVVIYKGADSVVAAPDGRVAIAAYAPPWLATAGTGDVLAGLTGAMLARGLHAFEAAQAAVWLHNRAAHLAGPGLIADDLLLHLPQAMAATL